MNELRLFHRFFGIIIAYFGFFIFFSGAFGFYRNEITLFMQPEYYKLNYNSPNYLKFAINYLTKNHKNADMWEIIPPSPERPYINISYKNDTNAFMCSKKKPRINLNPQTGKRIIARSTFGGDFLGALHHNLWFINIPNARAFMGYIGLFMLLALISGIIINKRIFKDFFKFRQFYFWRDMHILISVSGFVIFFALCISGIYLSQRFMLREFYEQISSQNQILMQQNFEQKVKAKREAKKNKKIQSPNIANTANKALNFIPSIEQIENIIKQNNRKITKIYIQKDSPKTAYIQLNFSTNQIFSANGIAFEAQIYDIKSQKLILSINEKKLNFAQKTNQLMRIFHKGEFGGSLVKFIFFVFGILGALMCISAVKSIQKRTTSPLTINIINFCNNSIFLGLNLALGAYLLSNKIIAFETRLRHFDEINCFFIALVCSSVIAVFKKYSKIILSAFISFLFFTVAIISLFKGAYENAATSQIAIFLILYAFLFACFTYKFIKEKYELYFRRDFYHSVL